MKTIPLTGPVCQRLLSWKKWQTFSEVVEQMFPSKRTPGAAPRLDGGHEFAVAPRLLAEFVHVVTDAKRLKKPLPMDDALARAEHLWQAREVFRLFPDGETTTTWISWLRNHRIGRQRLLDTILAAACASRGILTSISNNGEDFQVFRKFHILTYRA